ncbi:MAG: hypothetical protein AB7G76_15105 [Steroidobacteraceae bacterium]
MELRLNTPTGQTIAQRITDPSPGLHVPHLANVEVAQALRRYVTEAERDAGAAADAIGALHALDVRQRDEW